jgi:hypothetical protein
MVVLNFIILVIRICFGQFYKIRRASDFEFIRQAEARESKTCLASAWPD